jgi:transposase-like protein
MMLILKGVADATVKLKCPHCGKLQLRAKKERAAGYLCRACHKRFTQAQAR